MKPSFASELLSSFSSVAALSPVWMSTLVVLLSLLTGIGAGWILWRRVRHFARLIETETRQLQSDYDLASRDIMKLKHEVTARLSDQR